MTIRILREILYVSEKNEIKKVNRKYSFNLPTKPNYYEVEKNKLYLNVF